MTDKVLATFRIDAQEWEAFKDATSADNSNASALLTEFVRWYNHGNRFDSTNNHLDNSPQQHLDKHLDNLDELLDKRIDKHLDNLDELLDKRIDKHLAVHIDAIYTQLEDLRGKLPAR